MRPASERAEGTAIPSTLIPNRPGRRPHINPSRMELTMERDITLASDRTTAADALDLLWGAVAIAEALGRTPRSTFHLLENGEIPSARKVGGRWVVSRKKLLELFEGAAA